MTTWIESSNLKQDGTPVTTRIKIPEMAEDIWFTTNAYAEVSDDVADFLADNISTISKLSSAPSSPGTYYGDASDNTTIQINISDGVFDDVTSESVATDKATIGNANPVQGGPVGDVGDFVLLDDAYFSSDSYSTTATTYEDATTGGVAEVPIFDLDSLRGLTNIESLHASFVGTLYNDTTGETTYVRIAKVDDSAATEVSATGTDFTRIHSSRSPDTTNGMAYYNIELKVTAGTGYIYRPRVVLWGKVA